MQHGHAAGALAVLAAAVFLVALAAGAAAQTTGGPTATTTTSTSTDVVAQGGLGSQATPCTVTSTSSGLGSGTFRGEIAAASGGGCSDGSGNQVVTVQAGLAPIALATAPNYFHNEPLILNGNHFTIHGGPANRILTVATSAPATINDGSFVGGTVLNTGGAIRADGPLTLNGDTFTSNTGGDGGGAVSDDHGPLGVNNSTFQNNISNASPGSGNGGALRLHGPGDLTVTDSTFSGNHAQAGSGGAIWVDAGSTTTITGSTFTDNSTTGDAESGGAVFANLGAATTLTVIRSTLSQNESINGAAIAAPTGTVTLTNSTVTGNLAHSDGGGISAETVALTYSDIVSNGAGVAGSNVQILGAMTLETFGSVIADGGADNCQYASAPNATSIGYNYVSDGSCFPGGGAVAALTDLVIPGGDPQLGSLGSNGGPTETLLPASTSPLINAIPLAACQTGPLATGVTSDQRGVGRPQGTGCDIGAVEVQGSAPPPVLVTPTFTG